MHRLTGTCAIRQGNSPCVRDLGKNLTVEIMLRARIFTSPSRHLRKEKDDSEISGFNLRKFWEKFGWHKLVREGSSGLYCCMYFGEKRNIPAMGQRVIDFWDGLVPVVGILVKISLL